MNRNIVVMERGQNSHGEIYEYEIMHFSDMKCARDFAAEYQYVSNQSGKNSHVFITEAA